MRIWRDDDSTDAVGRMHVDAATGANGGPMHTHPLQEERFIVQTGVLVVRRGHERTRVGPGEDIRVPPRMPHTWRAETESSLVVELRPALRTWEFWRDLFALPTDRRGNPRIGEFARLMLAYPDESPYFRPIPPPLQNAVAVLLSKLASARS
jgi:hypothetical protein